MEAVTRVACASRALVRIEFAAPVPTAVRARSTSAEVSFNCAPTSEETVSNDCCAARAPVWMVSLVLTTRLVSERSASSTWDLMPGRQFLGAGHQAVAGLPSAALDAAGHGFDARAQQVFELRDAHVDIGGDRADAGFDALMDFLEPRGDGVGQMGAAAVDGLGDVGDAPVDRVDRLRGAVGQRRGEVGEARVDRLDRLRGAVGQRRREIVRRESIDWIACVAPSVSDVASVPSRLSMVSVTDFARGIEGLFERLEAAVDGFVEGFDLAVERGVEMGDAVSERGFELQQALVQRGGDLAAVRGQAGVEVVDIGLQAFGDVLGALAHAIDDLAAEGFDGAIEFRDVAGDQRAERAAVAGEFFRQLAALVLHQFVERAHLQATAYRARFRSG